MKRLCFYHSISNGGDIPTNEDANFEIVGHDDCEKCAELHQARTLAAQGARDGITDFVVFALTKMDRPHEWKQRLLNIISEKN